MEPTHIVKINPKQTKMTTAEGLRYKAKVGPIGSCKKCAMFAPGGRSSCRLGGVQDGKCVSTGRSDSQAIVWKIRKEKPSAAGANICLDV